MSLTINMTEGTPAYTTAYNMVIHKISNLIRIQNTNQKAKKKKKDYQKQCTCIVRIVWYWKDLYLKACFDYLTGFQSYLFC